MAKTNALKKRAVELEDAVVRLFTLQGPAPVKKAKKKSSRKAPAKRAAAKTVKRAAKKVKRKSK